jgi:hypothetical protein
MSLFLKNYEQKKHPIVQTADGQMTVIAPHGKTSLPLAWLRNFAPALRDFHPLERSF